MLIQGPKLPDGNPTIDGLLTPEQDSELNVQTSCSLIASDCSMRTHGNQDNYVTTIVLTSQ